MDDTDIRADERRRCAEYIEAILPVLAKIYAVTQDSATQVVYLTTKALAMDLRRWDGVNTDEGTNVDIVVKELN